MEMIVDYSAIGQRIKNIRKSKSYTQERLAENLGVSIVYVSQIENGKTKLNIEMLLRISHLLDTEPGYFLTGIAYHSQDYPESEIATLLEECPSEKQKLLLEIMKVIIKN